LIVVAIAGAVVARRVGARSAGAKERERMTEGAPYGS
jgi:hypothetical protein